MREESLDQQPTAETYLRQIAEIDRLLKDAVTTLIQLSNDLPNAGDGKLPTAPAWLSEEGSEPESFSTLLFAVLTSTLQRTYRVRRRLRWLTKQDHEDLIRLNREFPKRLMFPPEANPKHLAIIKHLAHPQFGALDPLTAAEVFLVLLQSGEILAHASIGFLAFFTILWAVTHREPRHGARGAALDTGPPTAAVTSKCLLPLRILTDTLNRRGRLYQALGRNVTELEQSVKKNNTQGRWEFATKLDVLTSSLNEMASIAINHDDFARRAGRLEEIATALGPNESVPKAWETVRNELHEVLKSLQQENKKILVDAENIVQGALKEIVEKLENPKSRGFFLTDCRRFRKRGDDEYWRLEVDAAKTAQETCANAIKTLKGSTEEVLKLPPKPNADELTAIFNRLATASHAVAKDIEKQITDTAYWCSRLVQQEIANASAGNATEFDPAELAFAISVTQLWLEMTDIEVSDAVDKVLVGMRNDGSWTHGHPVFLQGRLLGVWPGTVDVIWSLAIAVHKAPEVRNADPAFWRFLSWLDRTKVIVNNENPTRKPYVGWSTETVREGNTIDLWSTCIATNALLEIRDVAEERLWQLCRERFTVLETTTEFKGIDPVDLGARHGERLHYRLTRAIRLANAEDYKDAEYAFVVHGPPGSSKTVMAEALGNAMWKRLPAHSRVIRITPADFTRSGEEGLDAEAHAIFRLLGGLRRTTIFFDEIDDLLRRRIPGEEPSFIKLVVPGMLNRLQDLRNAAPHQQLTLIIATNFVDKMEPALLRPGRIDMVATISYPDAWSRRAIVERFTTPASKLTPEQRTLLATRTAGWPWTSLKSLCAKAENAARTASINTDRLNEIIEEGAEEFQTADYYYLNPARWQEPSPALVREFVQWEFCTATEKSECRRALEKHVKDLQKKEVDVNAFKFKEAFSTEWRRQGRNG